MSGQFSAPCYCISCQKNELRAVFSPARSSFFWIFHPFPKNLPMLFKPSREGLRSIPKCNGGRRGMGLKDLSFYIPKLEG